MKFGSKRTTCGHGFHDNQNDRHNTKPTISYRKEAPMEAVCGGDPLLVLYQIMIYALRGFWKQFDKKSQNLDAREHNFTKNLPSNETGPTFFFVPREIPFRNREVCGERGDKFELN
jgi:hypothetical protein